MKKREYDELKERFDIVEQHLKDICNWAVKMKRSAERKGHWFSSGIDPYRPLTEEDQQGPLVTEFFVKIEEARKHLKKV